MNLARVFKYVLFLFLLFNFLVVECQTDFNFNRWKWDNDVEDDSLNTISYRYRICQTAGFNEMIIDLSPKQLRKVLGQPDEIIKNKESIYFIYIAKNKEKKIKKNIFNKRRFINYRNSGSQIIIIFKNDIIYDIFVTHFGG